MFIIDGNPVSCGNGLAILGIAPASAGWGGKG